MLHGTSFRVKRTMTPDEGFVKVKSHLNNSKLSCGSCRDYGTDYMYFLAPSNAGSSKRMFTGLPYIVNKKSGKVYEYGDVDLAGKPWDSVEVR